MNMSVNEVPAGSPDYYQDVRGQLERLMPEVFTDGAIDFQKMKEILAGGGTF